MGRLAVDRLQSMTLARRADSVNLRQKLSNCQKLQTRRYQERSPRDSRSETCLRELIFICSLPRSEIANPSCEKGTVSDFEDADRTRCMVRSTFLIVTDESPSCFFFHAQSDRVDGDVVNRHVLPIGFEAFVVQTLLDNRCPAFR
jgi:hypothetical protein